MVTKRRQGCAKPQLLTHSEKREIREGREQKGGEGKERERRGMEAKGEEAALFPFHPVAFAICIVRTL